MIPRAMSDGPLIDSREVNPATGESLTPNGAPLPGSECPACEGTGGRMDEECPSIHSEWIDCKACEGTGEYWPEEQTPAAVDKVTP